MVHNYPRSNTDSFISPSCFCELSCGQTFWNKIEDWLQTTVVLCIEIGGIDKIFGWDSPDTIVSRVIITAIQTIYQKRQSGKLYHLFDVKRLLDNQLMLEERLSISNNREIQFEKVWGLIYLNLSGL